MTKETIIFAARLFASVVLVTVGSFYSVVVYAIVFVLCFRDGYRNIFWWKDRKSSGTPVHYHSWDVTSRKNPNNYSTKWNHAYVTVPESGLRFHYVHSGTVPSDIIISDVDRETHHALDNNNIVANRPKLLICVHGFPENWFAWRYILRFFDKPHPEIGEYFVIAPDMRGYGDSDKPSGYKSYHRNLLSSDVKGIALALGYETFSVMGHDWGAAISYSVAENFPESVEKLIILNGPEVTAIFKTIAKNPLQIIKSWYMVFFQIPWASELFVRLYDFGFSKEIMTGESSGIRNPNTKLTDEEMEMFKYGIHQSTEAPINYYRSLLWPFSEPGPKLLYPKESGTDDPLKNVSTLIMWGENDAFLSETIPEMTMMRLDPKNGSKLVSIKNSSHWIQQDQPDEVIRCMVEFLKCYH